MCVFVCVFVSIPPVFPNSPGGWTLDGDNREQVSYMPASAGGVVMPPVPPRSFPPGSTNCCHTVELASLIRDHRRISTVEENIRHFRLNVIDVWLADLRVFVWALCVFARVWVFLTK